MNTFNEILESNEMLDIKYLINNEYDKLSINNDILTFNYNLGMLSVSNEGFKETIIKIKDIVIETIKKIYNWAKEIISKLWNKIKHYFKTVLRKLGILNIEELDINDPNTKEIINKFKEFLYNTKIEYFKQEDLNNLIEFNKSISNEITNFVIKEQSTILQNINDNNYINDFNKLHLQHISKIKNTNIQKLLQDYFKTHNRHSLNVQLPIIKLIDLLKEYNININENNIIKPQELYNNLYNHFDKIIDNDDKLIINHTNEFNSNENKMSNIVKDLATKITDSDFSSQILKEISPEGYQKKITQQFQGLQRIIQSSVICVSNLIVRLINNKINLFNNTLNYIKKLTVYINTKKLSNLSPISENIKKIKPLMDFHGYNVYDADKLINANNLLADKIYGGDIIGAWALKLPNENMTCIVLTKAAQNINNDIKNVILYHELGHILNHHVLITDSYMLKVSQNLTQPSKIRRAVLILSNRMAKEFRNIKHEFVADKYVYDNCGKKSVLDFFNIMEKKVGSIIKNVDINVYNLFTEDINKRRDYINSLP